VNSPTVSPPLTHSGRRRDAGAKIHDDKWSQIT
jgi:hypothetical protein